MNVQTLLQNILARLTPEYFAERVIRGAFNVLVILILMFISLRIWRCLPCRLRLR